MSNELPHYPALLQRENGILFELMGSTIGGGQTASGVMPLARLDGGGLWKATMSDIPLVTADQVRAWRALAAICDGGVQPLIVSMCDKRQFPAPTVSGELLYSNDDVPHSDDAPFSDNSEYASDVVNATLAADAALRDTSITIDIAAGGDLQGGEHFSIDHEDLRWRLYRIRTAVDNGDGTYDCTIRPPLRAATLAGTQLQFDHPKCVMRLASSSSMDLKLSMRRFGQPSVDFVEAFPPFPVMPVAATPPPSWVPRADGVLPTVYAEFSTEGGFNHYWYGAEYGNFAELLAALVGTFTGSANGTRINASGLREQAVSNTPRFEFNPATLAAKGLLIEGERTNLALRSRELGTTWAATAMTAVTADQAAGPDGTTTAELLIPNTSLTIHNVSQTGMTSASHTRAAVSGSGKTGGGYNWALLQVYSGSAGNIGGGGWFDFLNGVAGATRTFGAGASIVGTQIRPDANGYYRGTAILQFPASTLDVADIITANANSALSWAGNGTSGLYVTDMQVEAGSFASSSIPATSAAVTRATDSLTRPRSIPSTIAQVLFGITPPGVGTTEQIMWSADDGTTANRIRVTYKSDGHLHVIVTTAASDVVDLDLGAVAVNTAFKLGFRAAANDFAATLNGGTMVTDAAGVMPAGVVNDRLGAGLTAGEEWFSTISLMAEWSTASNSELQRLTT